MYNIQPRMSNNYSLNSELNKLLDHIDNKILGLAQCKYNNITLRLIYDANLDLYDDLTTYKKILLNKLLGCNCLDDQRLIKIVSKIKKLLR
jgi:hypothetical protein